MKVNRYITPPILSTSFSESGRRAKKRFENILNTKARKTSVLAFVLVLLVTGAAGVIFSFNSGDNIVHRCKTFDCSFELPQGWENKYEIEGKISCMSIIRPFAGNTEKARECCFI